VAELIHNIGKRTTSITNDARETIYLFQQPTTAQQRLAAK